MLLHRSLSEADPTVEPEAVEDAGVDLDQEIPRVSLPSPLSPLRDLQKARDFLLGSTELNWLVARLRLQMNWQNTGVVSDNVRKKLVGYLDKQDDIPHVTLVFHDWDPINFLASEYASGPRDLSSVVVYCGDVEHAYAASISEYVQSIWAHNGQATLASLQAACGRSYQQFEATIAGARTSLSIQELDVRVEIAGDAKDVLEVAEILVWMATACRKSSLGHSVEYCSPSLWEEPDAGHDTGTWISVRLMNCLLEEMHTERRTNGSCWIDMVRNPVIAVGYPVPRRHHSANERGLEVSLPLAIALSHANWATSFQDMFALKGIISALVPVLQIGSSIVWHFILNKDEDDNGDVQRVTYNQMHSVSRRLDKPLSLDTIEEKRHFIGLWTDEARTMVDTDDAETYKIELSKSESADKLQVELSNISVAAGKYVTIGAGFRISRKDIHVQLARSSSRPFELQMEHASKETVLFYSTHDRRGWMIDGATALLYLARCWMFSRSPESVGGRARRDLHRMSQRGGKQEALNTLMKNNDENIQLFNASEVTTDSVLSRETNITRDSTSDSGYSSLPSRAYDKRKDEEKTHHTSFTFGQLAVEQWQVLQAMRDRLFEARRSPPSLKLDPRRIVLHSPVLTGWDARDLLTLGRPLDPRSVRLDNNASEWIEFIRASSSVVLLARTFGDLLIPQERGLCLRQSRMPPQLDLLAVPLHVLHVGAERWIYDDDDHSNGCVQIHDDFFWHSFDPFHSACDCKTHPHCRIISRIGKSEKKNAGKGAQNDARKVNVVQTYPNGVALIGGPTKLSKIEDLPRLSWAGFQESRGVDEVGVGAIPSQPGPSHEQPIVDNLDARNVRHISHAPNVDQPNAPRPGPSQIRPPALTQPMLHNLRRLERSEDSFRSRMASAAASAAALYAPNPQLSEDEEDISE